MVQTRRSNLKSRSWRLEQPIRKKPYFETIVYGVLLGYRRTKDNGTWLVRVTKKDGTDWTKAFAKADDYDDADGQAITIRGKGEAEAAKSLAVFQQNPNLANFLFRLNALESSLKERSTLIFDARTPPFDLFNGSTNLLGK